MAVPSNTYGHIAYGMRTLRAISGKVGAILRQAGADRLHDLLAPPHSMVTLAALATSLHPFKSALMRSVNSAGVLLAGSVASVRSCCWISGACIVVFTSASSRLRISFGMPLGANSPVQNTASAFGTPASVVVGTSGSSESRL